MLKGLNKRGQDLPVGALVLIVLGVLVLVGLGWIFFSGTNRVTNTLDQAPGSAIEAAVQGCELAAKGQLYVDYCTTFKKLTNKDYINCEDPRLDASPGRTKLQCNSAQVQQSAFAFCESQKFGDDVIVGSYPCSNKPLKTCIQVGAETPDNVKTSSEWRPKGQVIGGCPPVPAIAGDKKAYADVTGQVSDSADKSAHANELCCMITDPDKTSP